MKLFIAKTSCIKLSTKNKKGNPSKLLKDSLQVPSQVNLSNFLVDIESIMQL